jgi:RimJ/RimL family protein N-acetyltransferase
LKTITTDSERVNTFVARQMGLESWLDGWGIGLEEDGELIAGVTFDNFNGASICMHVAAAEGKRWMTREYLWFCFHYPFEQLGVKRITGLVPASNTVAQRFDEHLGFKLEARLKDAAPDGDLLVYAMFKDDCRFLRMKRHG